jgi:hypothetical protein
MFCEANSFRRVPHLPYSPDLALSGFFLFGYTKHCLKGSFFSSEEELLLEIQNVLRGKSLAMLLAVFEDWMERLVWVAAYEDHCCS